MAGSNAKPNLAGLTGSDANHSLAWTGSNANPSLVGLTGPKVNLIQAETQH